MNNYDSIHNAYLGALYDVLNHPDYITAPRGLPIREKVDYMFRVTDPVAEAVRTLDLERNKVIAEYTAKEIALYDSCSNLVEDFGKASKFWLTIANPDATINSAYGHLIWAKKSHGNPGYGGEMMTPWEWAKQCLLADKDTRQAIMRFGLPEHAFKGVKDFTCTMHGNWLIRDDKLHFTITMRSNDLNKGLVYDMTWFVSLMDKMVLELKDKYPTLEKGSYTHIAHSSHIYEKDVPTIQKMLGASL